MKQSHDLIVSFNYNVMHNGHSMVRFPVLLLFTAVSISIPMVLDKVMVGHIFHPNFIILLNIQ